MRIEDRVAPHLDLPATARRIRRDKNQERRTRPDWGQPRQLDLRTGARQRQEVQNIEDP